MVATFVLAWRGTLCALVVPLGLALSGGGAGAAEAGGRDAAGPPRAEVLQAVRRDFRGREVGEVYLRGAAFYRQGDPAAANAAWRQAAAAGDRLAAFELALSHVLGEGTAPDLAAAAAWIGRAGPWVGPRDYVTDWPFRATGWTWEALSGAQVWDFYLDTRLWMGATAFASSEARAAAAAAGDPRALTDLAVLGLSPRPSVEAGADIRWRAGQRRQAVARLERAAPDDPLAAEILGYVSAVGFDAPADPARAAGYFRQAEALGSPTAIMALAHIALLRPTTPSRIRRAIDTYRSFLPRIEATLTSGPSPPSPVHKRQKAAFEEAVGYPLHLWEHLNEAERAFFFDVAVKGYFDLAVVDLRFAIADRLQRVGAQPVLVLGWLLLPFAEELSEKPRQLADFMTWERVGRTGLEAWETVSMSRERRVALEAELLRLLRRPAAERNDILMGRSRALIGLAPG